MTAADKHNLWIKFHRFQQRYENMYHPDINKALKAQVQTYIDNKDTVYIRSGGLYLVLLDLYKTVGTVWARHSRFMLSQKKGLPGRLGFNEYIIQLIQQQYGFNLLADAENITQTTIRLIQEVLTEAAAEGFGIDEIVNRITTPEFTSTRARLIARTETVGAANAGALINAKASGRKVNKIWVAARDNRTRRHHREVDNTSIPVEDKFTVGGYQMDHPGDKAAGAEEVCNCRCCLAFAPMD